VIKPIVNFLIQRKAREDNRLPSIVHGDLIMHVAVVASALDPTAFGQAKAYVKELRGRGLRTVDFYIHFPNKKALEGFQANRNEFPFIKRDFNWLGKYRGETLKQSVGKEYDVLIDLTRGRSFAADVFIAKTKARWKAGEMDEDRAHLLDFMIDVKHDPDLRKLIHHLDHYLTNFNKSNAA
jgi:hypothetical protein